MDISYAVRDPERYGVVKFDRQGTLSASRKNRRIRLSLRPRVTRASVMLA
jgi:dTDP-glucose pyrophosphorylase